MIFQPNINLDSKVFQFSPTRRETCLYARTDEKPVPGTWGHFGGSPCGHEQGGRHPLFFKPDSFNVECRPPQRNSAFRACLVVELRSATTIHVSAQRAGGRRPALATSIVWPIQEKSLAAGHAVCRASAMLCVVRRTFRSFFSTNRNERFSFTASSEHFRLSRNIDGGEHRRGVQVIGKV